MVLMGVLVVSPQTNAEPKTLIFSHVVGSDTPKGKMALMFKDLIEERMGDRYRVKIYENAELMSDVEAVDAVANGDIQFAAPALSKFTKYTAKLKVFDLPFIFPDMDAVNRFQQSFIGQMLLNSMTDEGIKGIGYLHNGLKQLSADRPFIKPDDLAGLKFRIINTDVLRDQFRAVDARPIPIPWPDTYEAIKNGRVNGQENTWSNIFASHFYEYQPYIMESNHGVLDYMLITNKEFWNSLSDDDKRLISYALNMALKYGNAVAVAKSINDKFDLRYMDGVTLIEPSKKQLREWREVMRPIWKKYESIIGKSVVDAAIESSHTVVSYSDYK